MKRIVSVLLLTIPGICGCETIAYSPSIPGMPLIFHFDTALLEPFPFSGITWTQMQNALLIRSSYTEHLHNLPRKECCSEWNVWADGIGQWLQQENGKHPHFGYNNVTGGLTLGADTCFKNFTIGVAASYTFSDLEWKQSAGHSHFNSYYGGLYGSWDNGCFYVNGSLLGAYTKYHLSRNWHFRRVFQHPASHHNSGEVLAGMEAGVRMPQLLCSVDLVPFAGVDYVYLSQPDYTERSPSAYNLHVKSRNDQLVQSEIGLRFFRRLLCINSWTLAPNLSFSYINQAPLTSRLYTIDFVEHKKPFNVKGWNFERNLGAVDFNLNFFNCTETLTFTLHYDGQFGKNYWIQTGSLLCNVSF